jgi:hypothetical protein
VIVLGRAWKYRVRTSTSLLAFESITRPFQTRVRVPIYEKRLVTKQVTKQATKQVIGLQKCEVLDVPFSFAFLRSRSSCTAAQIAIIT